MVRIDAILKDYDQSCHYLVDLLKSGANLTDKHRLTIENTLAMIQLHYGVWVRHHATHKSLSPAESAGEKGATAADR